jgi:hypothetical protein
MNGKIKQKGLFRVSAYFNETEIQTLATEAEKLGYRRVGIPLKKQKPNGFSGEWVANTDGIAPMLKFFAEYYRRTEAQRLQQAADIARQEQALAEQKHKLGLGALFAGQSATAEQTRLTR